MNSPEKPSGQTRKAYKEDHRSDRPPPYASRDVQPNRQTKGQVYISQSAPWSDCVQQAQVAVGRREGSFAIALAHKHYLCYRCLRRPNDRNLSITCSFCRRVSYCSVICRELDWEVWHKNVCENLQRINQLEHKHKGTRPAWNTYYSYMSSLLHGLNLEHISLHGDSRHLTRCIWYQPYCSTCYRSAENLFPLKQKLSPCEKCHMIFKCKECSVVVPRFHSDEECARYRQFVDDEMYKVDLFRGNSCYFVSFCTSKPKSVYQPLCSAKNWFEFYGLISMYPFIKEITTEDFKECYPRKPADFQPTDWYRKGFRNATYLNTVPLTILAALEDCLPNLAERESISLHLIDFNLTLSSYRHNTALQTELFHLLPSLRHLEVVIISPLLSTELCASRPATCCEICKHAGRTMTLVEYKGMWSDYIGLTQARKPDLAVMFNGSISNDPNTTRRLIELDVLTVGTASNLRQSLDDFAKLEALDAHIIVEPEDNKWKCLLQDTCLLSYSEHVRIQLNQFRYMFRGIKVLGYIKPNVPENVPRGDKMDPMLMNYGVDVKDSAAGGGGSETMAVEDAAMKNDREIIEMERKVMKLKKSKNEREKEIIEMQRWLSEREKEMAKGGETEKEDGMEVEDGMEKEDGIKKEGGMEVEDEVEVADEMETEGRMEVEDGIEKEMEKEDEMEVEEEGGETMKTEEDLEMEEERMELEEVNAGVAEAKADTDRVVHWSELLY